MAELIVMGDYQGPGEQQTAETLARDLPRSWKVVFGRKLSGARRDDLDFIVVGEHAVFLLEEKHWGPRLELGDQIWLVNGRERKNPLDRVNHLARVLAGQFRGRVAGYRAAVGGDRLVIAAVVLSDDAVTVTRGPSYVDEEPVLRLADAASWLVREDARYASGITAAREALIAFLRGLPGRDVKPTHIGPYDIVEEIEPIETARCFHARHAGQTVLLRCYPMHGWGSGATPQTVVERERLALRRLEERDRTWLIYPSFEDEVRQWIVVPVVPARGKNLAASVRLGDPARDDGRLPRQVATDVVTDAFRGLAEVHAARLVHRGLSPRRIFLGRGLRVKFSDFYLARVSGEDTIAHDVTAAHDAGVPYRAPECRDGIAFARPGLRRVLPGSRAQRLGARRLAGRTGRRRCADGDRGGAAHRPGAGGLPRRGPARTAFRREGRRTDRRSGRGGGATATAGGGEREGGGAVPCRRGRRGQVRDPREPGGWRVRADLAGVGYGDQRRPGAQAVPRGDVG